MRKYTYKPHLVIIRNGKPTRSTLAATKLMEENGISFCEAQDIILEQWVASGKIKGERKEVTRV